MTNRIVAPEIELEQERDREKKFDEMALNLETAKKNNIQRSEHPENYIVNEKGIFLIKYPKEEEGEIEYEWICSPIWAEAHLRSTEGKNHTILIRVNDGEKDHLVALQRKTFNRWADLSEILLELNQEIPVHPSQQKYLQTYLLKLNPKKKMRCVEKAGWHDGQYIFPNGEVIGKTKEGKEGIYPINSVCPKGVGSKGTLESWQKNVLSLCAGNTRLVFSLGVAFASLCLGILGAEGGIFNLKGRSSRGKTKCLRAAISVIGSREYERSWKATANGLEGICLLHNDSLLPLDEFGQVDAREVGEIVYMVGNGIGKQRSSRDATPRDLKTWRTMGLSSGETGLVDHMLSGSKKARAGQLVRIMDVPAETDKHGCFEEIHSHKNSKEFADAIDEACKENYGTAARDFIEKIIAEGIEAVRQNMRVAADDFVADKAKDSKGKDVDGQVKRVAARFGIIRGALIEARRLGVLGNKISAEMIDDSVGSCYEAWLGSRGTEGDSESKMIIEQVVGILKENSEGKFAERIEPINDKRIRNSIWGYRDGSTFYLLPKAYKDHICHGHDQQQVTALLKERGILKPGSDGKSSRLVRIQAHLKHPDRFYELDIGEEVDSDD